MKVHELIQQLMKSPQDHIVVLSRDPEGNGYSKLSDDGIWHGNSKYHEDGEVSLSTLDDKHKGMGYTEEDIREGGEHCVVLYP